MATKTMIGGLLFCTVLVSVMSLIASNPLELEVTFGGASQVKNVTDRIYNGEVAEDHAYPWQVRLRWPVPGKPGFVGWCGGSIICPYFVMTAAHCVETSKITVFAGVNRLGESGEQRRSVIRTIIHPKFNYQGLRYDYAILKLRNPIVIRPETSPIHLPLPKQPYLTIPGTRFAVSGWGKNPTDVSDDLYVVSMYQYDKDQCNVKPWELCAGGAGWTCAGDSGGIVKSYFHPKIANTQGPPYIETFPYWF